MKCVKELVLAAAVLVGGFCGLCAPVSAATPASVQVHSTIKGTTLVQSDKSKSATSPAALYADVQDQQERQLPDGFLVYGSSIATAEAGTFHMYSYLKGNKGGGVDCTLTAKFNDAVTVNFYSGSGALDGLLRYVCLVNGKTDGSGPRRGGNISFKVTLHNSGSSAKPKNSDIMLTYFDGWGSSPIELSPSTPSTSKVDNKDRITITAEQTMQTFAYSINSGFTFDLANFGATTHLYLDPQTTKMYLTSDSGHDYRTPKTAVRNDAWTLYE